jgi:hypothetical protein
LNALLKLHKPDVPIRPVVNNTNPPTYEIALKKEEEEEEEKKKKES